MPNNETGRASWSTTAKHATASNAMGWVSASTTGSTTTKGAPLPYFTNPPTVVNLAHHYFVFDKKTLVFKWNLFFKSGRESLPALESDPTRVGCNESHPTLSFCCCHCPRFEIVPWGIEIICHALLTLLLASRIATQHAANYLKQHKPTP